MWKSNNNNTYLYSFFYYKDIEECTIQHCDECNAKGTICLTCDDGYVLDTDTSSGLTSCSLPTTCMIENCLKCNSAFTKCVTCDDGYSLTSAGKCATCEVNNCQVCTDIEDCESCYVHYYLVKDYTNTTCKYCTISQCLTCENYGTECGDC